MAPDIVIRMDVRPRRRMLIRELRLDVARYPRLPEAHPETWGRYMNDDDGVMVETISKGKVETVLYDHLLAESEAPALSRIKLFCVPAN